MKLSIIIPYYETPDLTLKLLDKLNQQKNNEIEIILIDDDNKNNLFLKDKVDIYIKNKINCGGAGSRNIGLDVASADYIVFIDCDDDISNDYISTILSTLSQNNDLTWISWTSIYGNAIANSTQQINIAPWGCIFKKDILKNIRFNDKLNVGEEPEFWETIFNTFKNLKIGYINKIIYNYNIRDNSATRRYDRGELSKYRNLK